MPGIPGNTTSSINSHLANVGFHFIILNFSADGFKPAHVPFGLHVLLISISSLVAAKLLVCKRQVLIAMGNQNRNHVNRLVVHFLLLFK